MLRDHQACLFASSSIADCGRDMRLPEPVLASHWPLAFIGFVLIGWVAWTFVREVMWPAEIEWGAREADAPKRSPDQDLRDAGE